VNPVIAIVARGDMQLSVNAPRPEGFGLSSHGGQREFHGFCFPERFGGIMVKALER
jgi:hypothetical protein